SGCKVLRWQFLSQVWVCFSPLTFSFFKFFLRQSLDKRAHHNALERKRRDHIKDSFTNLRDCIPSLSGEKVSRAHVLNKATEYIRQMQRNSSVRTVEIDELRKKNEILEEQVNGLEQAQETGALSSPEDLIASIAEKVQQRQLLRQQQQQQANSNKANKVQLEPSADTNNVVTVGPKDKPNETNTPVSSAAASVTPSSAPATNDQANSFNILANNIRTTQNLLSALAKNLPSTTNNQMRAIAARVLASPVRPQGMPPASIPRGVVTATTVPQLTEQLPKAVVTPPPLPPPVSASQEAVTTTVSAGGSQTSQTSTATTEASVVSLQGKETQTDSEDQPPTKRFKASATVSE
ncbi:PREDICTED: uncharacterized protein LOC100634141, partial [Amphimedon queenslandica]|uniref:BHLH domain-containing protein n=1 Tax=Amphimedon queenslandica TaxID=400682 RepID=A0AAN0IY54_AMPQE